MICCACHLYGPWQSKAGALPAGVLFLGVCAVTLQRYGDNPFCTRRNTTALSSPTQGLMTIANTMAGVGSVFLYLL